jgi:tRNA(adenine34) deaminase
MTEMMLDQAPNDAADRQMATDLAMMQHCIRLSETAAEHGEFPFAALVCQGDKIIVEYINRVGRTRDVTQHAEIGAISEAQKVLGRKCLSDCTLYSNVEPCVMCSFPTRETGISRVVFAITSPMMGGYSKWNVLRDPELSRTMPEAFGSPPEVIAGLCRREAEKVWWNWNPLIWSVIKYRGCFGGGPDSTAYEHLQKVPAEMGLIRRLLGLRHIHSVPR